METNSYGLSSEFFSLPRNGSERKSEDLLLFLFQGTEFGVVFSAEGFGREFQEFASIFVPRHGRRNSELFSLPLVGFGTVRFIFS